MSILQATAPAAKTTPVWIKNAAYAVEPIAPGECGTSAVRVTKLVNGETYDLLRTADNRLECSCPDWVIRHSDKGTCCKHLAFAVANGLLPAVPVVAPCPIPAAKPAPAPITRKDIKRAEAFGIKLPVGAPIAVEASAPSPFADVIAFVETLPVPAPVVQLIPPAGWESIEADDVESDPSEWPAWTDEERWTVADPDRSMDDETFSRLAAGQAPDFVAEPLPSVSVTLDELTADARRARREAVLTNPGLFDDAPAGFHWEPVTARAAILRADVPDRIEPRPTARPRFVPTDEDFAEELGWELGNLGENAEAPAGWEFGRLVAFYRGWLAGDAALKAETLEFDAWLAERDAERLDEIMGEPGDGWPMAERVEARGCIVARI